MTDIPTTELPQDGPEDDFDVIEVLSERLLGSRTFGEAVVALRTSRLREITSRDVEGVPLELVCRLARAASILASSHKPSNRKLAYTIATDLHLVTRNTDVRFDAMLRVILARIGNFPAISTDEKVEAAASSLPLRILADELALATDRTIEFGSVNAVLTDYQHDLWTIFTSSGSAAIAAPTSAGKSFVLQAYLESLFSSDQSVSVLYIVPTRALIAQVSEEIERVLSRVSAPPQITSVPPDPKTTLRNRAVYVFTPERLQLLLATHPEFSAALVVVDEAHLIADGARGVLLQWVLEEASSRSDSPQLLFASPMIANLGIFASLFGRDDIVPSRSTEGTVGQNMVSVQTLPERGVIEVSVFPDDHTPAVQLGRLSIGQTLANRFDKLVHIPATLGAGRTNIIYVNGAADAERVALQLADLFNDREPSERQVALAELARESVHKQYVLASCLIRGVGFHYANIPTNLRLAIEKAFVDGDLDFMVCTSTLLQGVNTPAQNIFMYAPEKGRNKPISPVDFWNLAGRAGRLRREFQGNIFLIDYADWKTKPLEGPKAIEIAPATKTSISDTDHLIGTILDNSETRDDGKPELASTFSKLLTDFRLGKLQETFKRLEIDENNGAGIRIEKALQEVSETLEIPSEILKQSPSVSPHRQQELLNFLRTEVQRDPATATMRLSPRHPRDAAAYDSYSRILMWCYRILLGFPESNRLHRFHALLAVWWTEGLSLPQIIQNQIDKKKPANVRGLIRDTLNLIEEHVRFKILRMFTTYTTLLNLVYERENISGGTESIPNIGLYLELGASDRTMISFMELGLSRVAARQLNDLAANKEMDSAEALTWLKTRSPADMGLSPLIEGEIEAARQRAG